MENTFGSSSVAESTYQNETKLANFLRAQKGRSEKSYVPVYESQLELHGRKVLNECGSSMPRNKLRDFTTFM